MTTTLFSSKPTRRPHESFSNARSFEHLLVPIQQCAAYAFRKLSRARREELIADVVANAYIAFVRLIERGLESIIYPTALAKYAVRQVRDGRRVGCRQNIRDVVSLFSQAKKCFSVKSLQ